MSTNQPEGFMREKLTIADMEKLLTEIRARLTSHFVAYGDGIFLHPQEIVGCMFGQQMKLSRAADESIYTGDLTDFKERCMKTLMAILVGTASVDKLAQLRAEKDSV